MLNLLHAAFYIYDEDMIKLFLDTTVPLTYIYLYIQFFITLISIQTHTLLT